VLKKMTTSAGWGLSSPAGVDYPVDGVLDYAYAGDQSGRLWRFDLTSPIGAALPDPHLVFSAGSGHPIIQKPVVKIAKDKDGNFLGNLVIFGTGSLLETADRLDNTAQTLYAVLDRKGSTTTLARNDLAGRVVEEAVVTGGEQREGTYRRIMPAPSASALDLTDPASSKSGWYLDLPVKSERLSTTPLLYDDRVLFGTGIPNSQEVCNTGYGWYMGLDPLTGLVVQGKKGEDFSFFDVKIDGKSTTEDMVKFPDGKSYYISGYKLDGIATNLAAIVKSIAYPSFATDNPYAVAAAGLAFYDSNVMSVATGRESSGKGSKVFVGELGSDKLHGFDPTKEASGVKVETTIWREIR
jgi:type IV pilus assembly protein PilY1